MATATGAQHNNKYRLSKSRSSFAANVGSLVSESASQGEFADALKEAAHKNPNVNRSREIDGDIETFERPQRKRRFSPNGAVQQQPTNSSNAQSVHSARRDELENINLEHVTDPSYRARAVASIKNRSIAYAKEEAKELIVGSAKRFLESKDMGELAELLEDDEFLDSVYDATSRSVKGDHEIAKAMARFMISWWTAKLWITWQWESIPSAITGVGILNFMAATIASWVALADTLFHPLIEKALGKTKAAALPPSFSFLPGISASKGKLSISGMSNGLSEFAFFMTAHAVWLLIFIAAVAATIVAVLPFLIPFFAAGVIIEMVTGG